MEKTLHILKDEASEEPLQLLQAAGAEGSTDFAVLLIQDAVRLNPSLNVPVYVMGDDLKKRGASSSHRIVSYDEMVEMILSAETVMTW